MLVGLPQGPSESRHSNRRVFGTFKLMVAAVTVGSIALASLPAAFATEDSSSKRKTCWTTKSVEKSMAKKINKARSKNDKVKMHLDPELSLVARRNSKKMAKMGALEHTQNLGDKVTKWIYLGENVGYGVSVKQLHKMFMNSEVHKDNVLKDSFRHMGVGFVKKGEYLWVTVVFESKKNPGTTLNMPSC
jgi:uncharacterized protein YkwD